MNTEQMREALQKVRPYLADGADHGDDAVELLKLVDAALTRPQEPARVGGVPDIDYEALIAAAFAKNKRWAQGTYGCIAFARGAEWYRDQVLTAAPQALIVCGSLRLIASHWRLMVRCLCGLLMAASVQHGRRTGTAHPTISRSGRSLIQMNTALCRIG